MSDASALAREVARRPPLASLPAMVAVHAPALASRRSVPEAKQPQLRRVFLPPPRGEPGVRRGFGFLLTLAALASFIQFMP